jgi:hypothetical protein
MFGYRILSGDSLGIYIKPSHVGSLHVLDIVASGQHGSQVSYMLAHHDFVVS